MSHTHASRFCRCTQHTSPSRTGLNCPRLGPSDPYAACFALFPRLPPAHRLNLHPDRSGHARPCHGHRYGNCALRCPGIPLVRPFTPQTLSIRCVPMSSRPTLARAARANARPSYFCSALQFDTTTLVHTCTICFFLKTQFRALLPGCRATERCRRPHT